MRPGKRRKLDPDSAAALAEKAKASVRAKSLPPTVIGGGASLPEVEASVRLRESPLPGVDEEHATAGAFVRAGKPADGGGTTEGVVRPAAGPNQPNGPSKPPNAPSGGNIQGAERQPARPERQYSPPFPIGADSIQAKTGLVQSIPRTLPHHKKNIIPKSGHISGNYHAKVPEQVKVLAQGEWRTQYRAGRMKRTWRGDAL